MLKSNDVCIDLGCGMGYFSLAMARIVGPGGRVYSVDLQREMLKRVERRALRCDLLDRITPHLCRSDTIGLTQQADFILAFWMVHEVPDQEHFLREVRQLLKPEGKFLLAEPRLHVNASEFQATLAMARNAGFQLKEETEVPLSRSAILSLGVSAC